MATRKPAAKKTTKTSKAKAAPKKTTASKKVTAAAKKPVKKTVKKAVKKTSPKKKAMELGASFECPVCGLEVAVEKVCDCTGACEIICCGEPMERI